MDGSRFDAVTRTLTDAPTRRLIVRAAFALWLGPGVLTNASITDGKSKRKGKRKRKKQRVGPTNAFGCIDVGDGCQTGSQCCSGICDGPRGKRTCLAHDAGSCPIGASASGCGAEVVSCTTNLGQSGRCGTTTGNADYCLLSGECYPCTTDLECQTASGGALGSTAACVLCSACPNTGGTMCAWISLSSM